MTVGDIREYLGEDWEKTQDLISSALRSDVSLLDKTNADILSNAGKQVRPMMTLLVARACGQITDKTRYCAAASEILHNATLMHDDVADESGTRRGRPTVASLLGPGAAVLIGDFWLAEAMAMILRCGHEDRILKLFSSTIINLAEGEMLQMEKAAAGDTLENDYLRIIRCKTASLFTASAVSGVISTGAPEALVEAAGMFADSFGVAFQIKDDILDYSGDEALGKPLGSDLQEGKITLPLLCALEGHPREAEIRKMVTLCAGDPSLCADVRGFVAERGGVAAASAILEKYVDKAVSALSAFPDSPARDLLEGIARYNSFRRI